MLSIIRQLYYHRCRPITPWPRVEIGAPDAWDQSVSASNQGHEYRSCTWSPCGRFVAAQTVGTVEIQSQLTFELLTTLQPTEIIGSLTGPLTYSPDGRSIACGSGTSILIWDIQTGGVARKIRCGLKNISMVWSSDGRKIGFIDTKTRVHTCDLVSGTTISPGKISPTADPYFWAHEESSGSSRRCQVAVIVWLQLRSSRSPILQPLVVSPFPLITCCTYSRTRAGFLAHQKARVFLSTASLPTEDFSQSLWGRGSVFGNTPLVFTSSGRNSSVRARPTVSFNSPQLNC